MHTCLFSAVILTVATVALAAVLGATVTYVAGQGGLPRPGSHLPPGAGHRRGVPRDEALISAIAISGRGVLVTLLAHLSIRAAHWSPAAYQAVMIRLVVAMPGQALTMARRGPSTGLHVPPELVSESVDVESVHTSTNL
ncbi:MAG: hypothetical protein ACRDZ8_03300, partial [Acidimicrobiales bacterium]